MTHLDLADAVDLLYAEQIQSKELDEQEDSIMEVFNSNDAMNLLGLDGSTMKTPYSIRISTSDIAAMVWIGTRYAHGTDLLDILFDKVQHDELEDYTCGEDSIEIWLPEHKAWMIHEIVDEDPSLSCFGPELHAKLLEFCNKIV